MYFTEGSIHFHKNQVIVKDSIFGFTTSIIDFIDNGLGDFYKYSKEDYNYSDPAYADLEYRIANITFSNSDYKMLTIVKRKTTIVTLLSFLGGLFNISIIGFRFMLGGFQRFSSNS